jgi:hypothetical protein
VIICRGIELTSSFSLLIGKPSFLKLLRGGSLNFYRISLFLDCGVTYKKKKLFLDCGVVVSRRRYFKFENVVKIKAFCGKR